MARKAVVLVPLRRDARATRAATPLAPKRAHCHACEAIECTPSTHSKKNHFKIPFPLVKSREALNSKQIYDEKMKAKEGKSRLQTNSRSSKSKMETTKTSQKRAIPNKARMRSNAASLAMHCGLLHIDFNAC